MKFSLWSFLALLSSTLASPLLEKRHSYSFVGCDAGQQNTINEVLDDVEALAAAAVQNSEAGIPSAAYEAWFGDGSGQKISDENVNTRFHKLSIFKTSVPKKDVAFDCTEKSPCCSLGAGAVPACGMQPGDDAVNICRGFWNWHQKERVYELAPPAGPTNERIDVLYRPRAYILLHELMHSQYGSLDVVDTVKDQFGKTFTGRGYGHEVCLRYALKSPSNARRNADTYALFAAASYYGIGNWQKDPNQLN